MSSGYLKYLARSSPMKSGKTLSGKMKKTRLVYSLPKQGRKRRSTLVMLGRLIGHQLANSALFNMAGSIVKRIKTNFFVDWARRYMINSANFTAIKPVAFAGEEDNMKTILGNSNSNQPTSLVRAGDATDCLADMNHNRNAKSSSGPIRINKSGKKRCKGRARCLVTRSTGRAGNRRRNQSKAVKSRALDRHCQQSQRIIFLRNRCVRLKREDVKVCPSPEKVDPLQFVEAPDTNPSQACHDEAVPTCQAEEEVEPIRTESAHRDKQTGATTIKESKVELVKEKRAGNKRRKRQKTEMKLSMFVLDPKVELGVESKDTKQKYLRKRSNPLRRKCEREITVAASQANLGSSTFSVKTNLSDVNDWPTLVERERPKGLIKEAVKEIVRNKQAGSVAKSARKLLADITAVMTSEADAGRQATGSFILANRQLDKRTIVTNHKSWASVASQSLVDPIRVAEGQSVVVPCLSNPAGDNKSSSAVEQLHTFKGQLDPDSCLSKEKPYFKKRSTEIEERTNLLKPRRSLRNRMKLKCEDKEPVLVLPTPQKNKQRKKPERTGGKAGCSPAAPLSAKFTKDTFDNCGASGRHSSVIQLWKKLWVIRGQMSSTDEESIGKQKKTSTRYRALLRSGSGRLDAKTVTEIQARSKMADSLLQGKTAARAKQCQERLESQRASHSSSVFKSMEAPTVSPGTSEDSYPYWLRSSSLKKEITYSNNSPSTSPVIEGGEASGVVTLNIESPVPENTLLRRSERLKAMNAAHYASSTDGCK